MNETDRVERSRWTPAEAVEWFRRSGRATRRLSGLEADHPGGHWVALYGTPVYLRTNGEIADETFPQVNAMKRLGDARHLGGAGAKDIYTDSRGQQFIFKPAQSKAGEVEEFRAHLQEAVSRIAARLFAHGAHVPVRAQTTADGKLGSVQPLVPSVLGNLKDIPWQSLSPRQLADIQREHVLDWVVGNFDSHAGNFILTADGAVLGVDKEQSFRNLDDPRSWELGTVYHPNEAYGEWPPVYNELYREYARGAIDLDRSVVDRPLELLRAIPDDEYRALLQPYARAARRGPGVCAAALQRKRAARAEFDAFFSRLR